MKIMFVLHSIESKGGLEVVEILKANNLVEKGHDVILFVHKYRGGWTPRPLSERVKVMDLGEELPSPYKKCGIPFILFLMKMRTRIQQVVRSEKVDVLVGTGMDNKWVVPFVQTPHGHKMIKIREYHLGSKTNLLQAKSRLQLVSAHVVNFVHERLLSHCYDKIFLLTHADKLAHFSNNKRYGVVWNPLTISDVCRHIGGVKKEPSSSSVVLWILKRIFPDY
jgi:hypothetical protein